MYRKKCVIFTLALLFVAVLQFVDAASNSHNVDLPEIADNSTNDTDSHHAADYEYHIAVFEPERLESYLLVSVIIILASLAKIGFHFNNKLSSIFPESCLLILLGVIVGCIIYFGDIPKYTLQSDVFFLVLLPPIILEAGYHMPTRAFFDNIGTILLFAVVGTIFNTVCIALSLWAVGQSSAVQGFSLLDCLVFGSLISAVDPVAVLAVFEEIHVNEVLYITVFGESLLNDAVTVVLYHMFESFAQLEQIGKLQPFDYFKGLISFLVNGTVATLIGILLGIMTSFITRFTDHVRVIEPLVVIVMGYLSYLCAEIFHFSGILACIACAVTMRTYVEFNISKKSHTTIKYFLKMVASVSETVIFVLLGTSVVDKKFEWDSGFIFCTLLFCLVYRAIGVIILSAFANCFRLLKLSLQDQFIMAYGGLRGAIAYSLVILLHDKQIFVAATIVVILFTVFILGSTIKPLVKILHVKKDEKHKPSMNEQINGRLIDHVMAGIEDISGHHGHHEMRLRFENINNRYLKRILLRNKNLSHRGQSIIDVYNKLNEKEALEMMDKIGAHGLSTGLKSTVFMAGMTNMVNIDRAIFETICKWETHGTEKRQTQSSGYTDNDFTSKSSMTMLDFHAVESNTSLKLQDDTKVHHVMEQNMFRPRRRFSFGNHKKHDMRETEERTYHHHARLHLRRLLAHQKHGHKHDKSKGSTHSLKAKGGSSKSKIAKKTVNFDLPNGHDAAAHDNDSEDEGITFSANPSEENDSAKKSSKKYEKKVTAEVNGVKKVDSKISVAEKQSKSATETSATEEANISNDQKEDLRVEQTAAETSLPWKRSSDTVALSTSASFSLPGEDFPANGESVSWFDAKGSSDVPSTYVTVPSSEEGDANETKSTDLNPDESLPWKTPNEPQQDKEKDKFEIENEIQPVVSKPVSLDVAFENSAFEDDTIPPPWRSTPSIETPQQGTKLKKSTSSSVDPVDGTKKKESKIPSEEVSTKKKVEPKTSKIEEGAVPPPPWRTPSVSDSLPARSPSASHELDSIRPQMSSHSLRLSEAESKHSDLYLMHHNVIDLPRRPSVDVDLGNTCTWADQILEGFEQDHEDKTSMDRVQQWLFSAEHDFLEPPNEEEHANSVPEKSEEIHETTKL